MNRQRHWLRTAMDFWASLNDKHQTTPTIRIRFMARGSKLGTTDKGSTPGYLKTWGSRPKDKTT